MTEILKIRNLHATVGDKKILNGVDLAINAGEVHAIMGPNGSGKSTLANVLAGHPNYHATGGSVSYKGKDLLEMAPEERARDGVFLSFQHPIEIPGVRMDHFIRAGYNAAKKAHGEEELDILKFDRLLRRKAKVVEMGQEMTKRAVNVGFSGGEKKRNEILQMALLEPTLAILDEVDSGLDIDALRLIAEAINQMRTPENGMLVVTHYQRLLDYIVPTHVHVLINGRIAKSGGKELALEVEARGYDWIEPAAASAGA